MSIGHTAMFIETLYWLLHAALKTIFHGIADWDANANIIRQF